MSEVVLTGARLLNGVTAGIYITAACLAVAVVVITSRRTYR